MCKKYIPLRYLSYKYYLIHFNEVWKHHVYLLRLENLIFYSQP